MSSYSTYNLFKSFFIIIGLLSASLKSHSDNFHDFKTSFFKHEKHRAPVQVVNYTTGTVSIQPPQGIGSLSVTDQEELILIYTGIPLNGPLHGTKTLDDGTVSNDMALTGNNDNIYSPQNRNIQSWLSTNSFILPTTFLDNNMNLYNGILVEKNYAFGDVRVSSPLYFAAYDVYYTSVINYSGYYIATGYVKNIYNDTTYPLIMLYSQSDFHFAVLNPSINNNTFSFYPDHICQDVVSLKNYILLTVINKNNSGSGSFLAIPTSDITSHASSSNIINATLPSLTHGTEFSNVVQYSNDVFLIAQGNTIYAYDIKNGNITQSTIFNNGSPLTFDFAGNLETVDCKFKSLKLINNYLFVLGTATKVPGTPLSGSSGSSGTSDNEDYPLLVCYDLNNFASPTLFVNYNSVGYKYFYDTNNVAETWLDSTPNSLQNIAISDENSNPRYLYISSGMYARRAADLTSLGIVTSGTNGSSGSNGSGSQEPVTFETFEYLSKGALQGKILDFTIFSDQYIGVLYDDGSIVAISPDGQVSTTASTNFSPFYSRYTKGPVENLWTSSSVIIPGYVKQGVNF